MTQGFISFGDGPPIPIGRVRWVEPKAEVPSEWAALKSLQEFSGMVELPAETAVALLRAVGLPAEADRFAINAHPDLTELNVQMDGFYDGLDAP